MRELIGLLAILIIIAIYFLPTFVAFQRRYRNRISVFIIDLFLGWTLVGWVVALALSFINDIDEIKENEQISTSSTVDTTQQNDKIIKQQRNNLLLGIFLLFIIFLMIGMSFINRKIEVKESNDDYSDVIPESVISENNHSGVFSETIMAEDNNVDTREINPEQFHSIHMVLNKPTWIEIKKGDKSILLGSVYKKGFNFDILPEKGLTITVGRPNYVEFYIGNKKIDIVSATNNKRVNLDGYFVKK